MENQTNNSPETVLKKISRLKRFFLFCAGASVSTLQRCTEDERNQYAGTGGAVFLTGLFAWLSGSVALYRVFIPDAMGDSISMESLVWAIIAGLCWAILIFNLDRLIVMSMKKRGSVLKQILTALPRIAVAIIISITISKPLEIKIFEKRIKAELYNTKIEESSRLSAGHEAEEDAYRGRIDDLMQNYDTKEKLFSSQSDQHITEINRLESELKRAKTNLRQYQSRLNWAISRRNSWSPSYPSQPNPHSGTVNRLVSTRNAAREDVAKLEESIGYVRSNLEEVRNRQNEISNLINTEISRIQEIANSKNKENTSEAADQKSVLDVAYSANFISQVEALGRVTQWNESGENTFWWTGKLIALLFLLIETAPIFVKLLMRKGVYDELVYQEEQQVLLKTRENALLKEKTIKQSQKENITANIQNQLEISEELLKSFIKLTEVDKDNKVINSNEEAIESVRAAYIQALESHMYKLAEGASHDTLPEIFSIPSKNSNSHIANRVIMKFMALAEESDPEHRKKLINRFWRRPIFKYLFRSQRA